MGIFAGFGFFVIFDDMENVTSVDQAILKQVPGQMNDSEILDFLYTKGVDWRHINAIRHLTSFSDDLISEWLNVSVRTLREYRKPEGSFKENIKEHVLLLLALMKHGQGVFGSEKAFDSWLDTPNYYFDRKKPSSFLNTVTGIKFINDRLTAMEYG